MLTFSERMDALDSLLAIIAFMYTNEVATSEELDAAVTEIWDRVDDIKQRTKVIENNLAILEEILSNANGD